MRSEPFLLFHHSMLNDLVFLCDDALSKLGRLHDSCPYKGGGTVVV